jgi:hypothetical protein
MHRFFIPVLLFCLAMSVISCEYNNEEELYPCDSLETTPVTYAATIVPILETNCYECHDAAAIPSGIVLEGYNNIKVMIDANRVIGSIRHLQGFSAMPKDRGSLPECDILKIEKWISQGYPNN